MIVWLTTFAFSIASALLPFLPIEIYILGAGATTVASPAEALWLGIAAGAGATVGKVVWYEAARLGVDSAWAQRKLSSPKVRDGYQRWVDRTHGRPWYAAGVMFLAASAGIPPLLVMSAVGGILKMSMWVFLPTVFLGRTLRFTLLFLGVDFAIH
ncbi:VTT domain-containing protein [Nocardioides sp. YIM 152588]|uniref:VTT domain-containing protein n=1 Tax=Nocardioides sp. YIM 152588 TaxID=3158259 RepID=UPI0032E37912